MEVRRDAVMIAKHSFGLDQSQPQHSLDVFDILGMAALCFGERLGVKFEMMEREPPVALDEGALSPPVRRNRNEILRRGELYVDVQSLLQFDHGSQDFVSIGLDPQVDIDRRFTPAVEHGGGATCEVNGSRSARETTERAHQLPHPPGVGYRAHSAALSKLTSRRMSAL